MLLFERPNASAPACVVDDSSPDCPSVLGMYLIAGHTVDGGVTVSDTFVDGPGLHCNTGNQVGSRDQNTNRGYLII